MTDPATNTAMLRAFAAQRDAAYKHETVATHRLGAVQAHALRMVSQEWRGVTWEHWLTLFVPDEIRHPGHAMLFVTGGDRGAQGPRLESSSVEPLTAGAERTGTVMAMLEQVPNQPLFDGLREDALVSYTFDSFIESGEPGWPLLLPMTRAAVRAMDTVQEWTQANLDTVPERFFVSGLSKRGWTTWLTAAADQRVFGIAPAVIDMLNIQSQMAHQLGCYGQFSEMIADYTSRDLQERLTTEEGRRLQALVDPYAHRHVLAVPKLIVLGTNDPYWTVDAASLYFHGLEGPAWLHYGAGAGHDVTPRGVTTILGFYQSLVTGRPIPAFQWRLDDEDRLLALWDEKPSEVLLWRADMPVRDFRGASWHAQALDGSTGARVELEAPDSGWRAHYVEAVFEHLGAPMSLCTEVFVRPKNLPFS